MYFLQYSDGNFVMLCFALLHREVLVVPTDKPLSEDQAWSYLRDIILGTEYCKSYYYQLRASKFDTQTQSLESQTLKPTLFHFELQIESPKPLDQIRIRQTLKPSSKFQGFFFCFPCEFFSSDFPPTEIQLLMIIMQFRTLISYNSNDFCARVCCMLWLCTCKCILLMWYKY